MLLVQLGRQSQPVLVKHCTWVPSRPAQLAAVCILYPMNQQSGHGQSTDLRAQARAVAEENGFDADFGSNVQAELQRLPHELGALPSDVRDLRNLMWSSIDNRESRDLDQVEFCER